MIKISKDISSVRFNRLNRLFSILASENILSREYILSNLDYGSSRTLERDITFLKNSYDVEIVYDKAKKGYKLNNKGTFMFNVRLSEREVLGIVSGLSMARHFLPHLKKEIDRLWLKIKSCIPDEIVRSGEKLGKSSVMSIPVSNMDSHVFDMVLESIGKKQNIRFSYSSPYNSKPETTRTVSPWGVFFQSHAWYLWGNHEKEMEGVTYRISRIKNIIYWPNEPYQPPPPDKNIHEYASSGWYGYTGSEATAVEIEIKAPLSDTIAETMWHPSQKFTKNDDGSVTMTADVPNVDAVARWIMASAPHARAVAPPELIKKVHDLAENMLKKHKRSFEK